MTPHFHSKEKGFATASADCIKFRTGMHGRLKTLVESCKHSGLSILIQGRSLQLEYHLYVLQFPILRE